MERIILHIDMDSFYAQVEEREDPSIKGRSVVVCMFSGRGEDSGAVAAANYTARGKGIKAGMPIQRAKDLDPEGVFLPARRDFYREVSGRLMDIVRSYADAFEQVSVDEAYLDVTEKTRAEFARGKSIAKQLKKDIKERVDLTCSVGVGPNKLISKMAANIQKPDGLTVVRLEEVTDFLASMPAKELFGVGKKTGERLDAMGIETISDLAKVDSLRLIEAFGNARGTWLYNASKGMDKSKVKERGEREQISRIKTLEENTRDIDTIMDMVSRMAVEVMGELGTGGLHFRTVNLIAVTEDLKTRTRSRTLPFRVRDLDTMIKVGHELLETFLSEVEGNLRRVGIGASELSKPTGQKTLLEF